VKADKQITVVTGVLIKDGQVLLARRDEEECPEAHLKWEIPGGKIDRDETVEEALEREFLEETGLTVKVIRPLPIIPTTYWKYDWGIQQTIVLCYQVKYVKGELSKSDHHIKDIQWFDLKDIDTLETVGETLPIIKTVS
jgi:8-oxo-dGTP diphosphatase